LEGESIAWYVKEIFGLLALRPWIKKLDWL
ncbi:MAG: hypothetical protein RL595_2248, partial [Planctomycetota bacterium]